jgi:hypothetical protein
MLQAEKSRVRFPMRLLDFFNLPNRSSRTMVQGSTQSLTEMITRNLTGGKGRPARKAHNLTTSPPSVSRLSTKCGSLDVSQTIWASTACYRDSFTFLLSTCSLIAISSGKIVNGELVKIGKEMAVTYLRVLSQHLSA